MQRRGQLTFRSPSRRLPCRRTRADQRLETLRSFPDLQALLFARRHRRLKNSKVLHQPRCQARGVSFPLSLFHTIAAFHLLVGGVFASPADHSVPKTLTSNSPPSGNGRLPLWEFRSSRRIRVRYEPTLRVWPVAEHLALLVGIRRFQAVFSKSRRPQTCVVLARRAHQDFRIRVAYCVCPHGRLLRTLSA